MTDRMTVAEAQEALWNAGARRISVSQSGNYMFLDFRDRYGWILSCLDVTDDTVSRASVNELVERVKK